MILTPCIYFIILVFEISSCIKGLLYSSIEKPSNQELVIIEGSRYRETFGAVGNRTLRFSRP
jgi:hypothetical protein